VSETRMKSQIHKSPALLSHEAERLGLSQDAGLPDTVRAAFAPVKNSAEAEAYTRQLTGSHYENFSVVSILLPKHLRQDFCNVYAFCRIADDLGDEIADKNKSLDYLAAFRHQLQDCFHSLDNPDGAGNDTAVFAALRQTIRRHNIPMKPFDDLIRAFEQDQVVSRYKSFPQLVDYCTRSADPVGRIVLFMCGYRDEQRQILSDKICTALQLVNFWQDVRRDILERDRIYLPAEDMQRFGITEEQVRQGTVTDAYRDLIRFQVERTEKLFDQGAALLSHLDPVYRKQIALFLKGGRAICTAIRRQKFDTLTKRPRLSKWQKTRLIGGTFAGYFLNSLAWKRKADGAAR
jgi:squalene synthase HpnC